jgi:hypothetical protein
MRERKAASEQSAKPVVINPRATTPKETWEKRKAAADQKVKRVQQASTAKRKPLPPLQGGAGYKESLHPRDRFGRFAVKALKTTGKAIKSTAKATGRAVKGTAKAVGKAHKAVKRVQSNARKRAALEHRERRLDLHKREQAAGLKRKKVARKRVRR